VAAEKKTNFVVTTDRRRPIADVAKDLAAAGFEVDQSLDAIGVLTGKSSGKALKKLRGVSGVTDVSPEPPPVDVGPPGSDRTW
jgi:hypothetical protein